mmetsp:Transcript_16883/g.30195  ORF Transcript_16883/g.30195 Transcript_16883/m.30195 type:complete len:99 (+) Transcript_16883:313-609(+)
MHPGQLPPLLAYWGAGEELWSIPAHGMPLASPSCPVPPGYPSFSPPSIPPSLFLKPAGNIQKQKKSSLPPNHYFRWLYLMAVTKNRLHTCTNICVIYG